MRGKVDFRAQTLDVGGTYVPMSGLMRVPAPIPLFGPLLTGPRGRGLVRHHLRHPGLDGASRR